MMFKIDEKTPVVHNNVKANPRNSENSSKNQASGGMLSTMARQGLESIGSIRNKKPMAANIN